jgi:hypothetical protein
MDVYASVTQPNDPCVEDLTVLMSALQTGHDFVPAMIKVSNVLLVEIHRRSWV